MSNALPLSAEMLSKMAPWGGALLCEDKQECIDHTAGKVIVLACAELPGVSLAGERYCVCSPFFGAEGESCAAHVAGATLAGALHVVPLSIALGTSLFILVTSLRYMRAIGSLPRTQIAASMLLSLVTAACSVMFFAAMAQSFVSESAGTSSGLYLLRNATLCVYLASMVVNVLLLTLVFNAVVKSSATGASGRRSSVIVTGVAVFLVLIFAVLTGLRQNALLSASATVVLVTTWAFYVRAARKLTAMLHELGSFGSGDGSSEQIRNALLRRTRVVVLRVVVFGAVFIACQVVFILTTPEKKLRTVGFAWAPVCSLLGSHVAGALLNLSIASYCCEPLLARLGAGSPAQTDLTTKPLSAWSSTKKIVPVGSASGSRSANGSAAASTTALSTLDKQRAAAGAETAALASASS